MMRFWFTKPPAPFTHNPRMAGLAVIPCRQKARTRGCHMLWATCCAKKLHNKKKRISLIVIRLVEIEVISTRKKWTCGKNSTSPKPGRQRFIRGEGLGPEVFQQRTQRLMAGQLADLAWGSPFFSQGSHKRSPETVSANPFQPDPLASLAQYQIRSLARHLAPIVTT